MDWWLIEYDNKNSDARTFAIKVQNELRELLLAAGAGPFGAAVRSRNPRKCIHRRPARLAVRRRFLGTADLDRSGSGV
jgi:hypothetical protein